jgi:hypothetical protein
MAAAMMSDVVTRLTRIEVRLEDQTARLPPA